MFKSAFDDIGRPIEEIDEIEGQICVIVRQLFAKLVNDGYSPTDIRAVSGYLCGLIQCEECCSILDIRWRKEQEKIKNADPNLDSEEQSLLQKGQKILAIKHYRARTELGLAESKKVVENWMEKHGIKITPIVTGFENETKN